MKEEGGDSHERKKRAGIGEQNRGENAGTGKNKKNRDSILRRDGEKSVEQRRKRRGEEKKEIHAEKKKG